MIAALGPYAGFILASYAATTAIVVALIAWCVVDHGRLTRQLAQLEAQGIRRRSQRAAATLKDTSEAM